MKAEVASIILLEENIDGSSLQIGSSTWSAISCRMQMNLMRDAVVAIVNQITEIVCALFCSSKHVLELGESDCGSIATGE